MAPLPFRSTFHKYRKVFRAIVARVILCGHAGFGVWWLASRLDSKFYGLLAVSLFLFALETGTILYFRAGCEWKRFCTPFAVYLLTLVPVLWILRLEAAKDAENSGAGNKTVTHGNRSSPSAPIGIQTTTNSPANIAAIIGDKRVSDLLRDQNVPSLLEQSMMFIIILCRWLLPRGRIDRSSLSQLLIMYSAISADILDFSEIFDRNEVISSNGVCKYVILGVWTWSLCQFTLVVTTSFQFRRRQQQNLTNQNGDTGSQDKSEALSILMVFFMQDGPFLLARFYAVFIVKIQDYQIIFFFLKNALTLILGLYRLLVLCGCITNEGNDLLTEEEVARSMESLDTIADDTTKRKQKKNKPKK